MGVISRRKKNSASGENLESSSAGQGTGEGKRALYHCNYCNKDITGKIRIKCAMCPDFDLCIECFSVGAEVTPHKSNHPYRVMDNLSFPLICPDWNADDEILLLEGIEMYGLGNWAEVAEHVGTKSKELCIEHYTNIYNSPFFPLPDMSHVVGKNRKELLAMAKGHGEDKKGSSMLGEHTVKEESPFSPSRVKVEEMHKGGPSGRLLSNLNADVESGVHPNSLDAAATAAIKKASKMAHVKDGLSVVKVEGIDTEYDNDAEQLLAEMEFKDTDTDDEHELKLRVLRSPSCWLSYICEADKYLEEKRKREAEESSHRAKESVQVGPSNQGGPSVFMASESVGKDSTTRPAGHYVNDMDALGFYETQLLSEAEKRLCHEIKLPPPLYLKMQEVMTKEIFSGNVTKKSDAHPLFKLEASKIDRVYDVLVKKGIAQP
ncbi:hypothetical protein GH714_016546 [Hevea brasiliensis]|uniref:Transcriptional adapter n=1 Tax=Hevea brasiliensis TaxID=3981 RepID=A0A6A6KN28_HEVBR|nr:hypothetical protein GH714_016546 [Hevea brasiliensis]